MYGGVDFMFQKANDLMKKEEKNLLDTKNWFIDCKLRCYEHRSLTDLNTCLNKCKDKPVFNIPKAVGAPLFDFKFS